ncbi:extracellular solute-binding protein [Paenibacillus sp. GCM10027626]|uniref:extracellular solute-binding protein n=1 Tax=Paenibacillus sp. GCM10027626 TaxID=3273411 RepID=UPI003625CCEA
MRVLRSGLMGVIAVILVTSLFLAACSSSNSGDGQKPPADTNNGKKKEEGAPPKEEDKTEPAEITKIRVTLWDRGITPPDAAPMKDNVILKYINEQMAPLGVEVEFAQIPRAEESEKLQVWMASGDAPDIILTYDIGIMNRFAEQGGLRELDDLLDKFGPDIKKNNAIALEQAGTYKGVRYAIPALRGNPYTGSNMSIRKDWLDKLNMKVPTTLDELTEVLRAFKEKDPGGIGKNNVVPFGLPALTGSGQSAFLYGTMAGMGIYSQGPFTESNYWQAGNYVDGKFTPSVLMPEGKEYFRWMNQLFKEGLISPEFATDANSQRFKQDFSNGYIGFFDANNPPAAQNLEARKGAPQVTYVTVDPFIDQHGKQFFNKVADYGMMIMIPKFTSDKKAEAAIKYLNWMVQPDVLITLNRGIEGLHWENKDGVASLLDKDVRAKDLWILGYGDLEIMQQGLKVTEDLEKIKQENASHPDLQTPEKLQEHAELTVAFYDMVRKYGKVGPTFTVPRPVNDRLGANLGKFLGEAVSKVIIADDFEKAYDQLLSGWKGNGGDEWLEEANKVLQEMGYTPASF